jgi:hypothetical protein
MANPNPNRRLYTNFYNELFSNEVKVKQGEAKLYIVWFCEWVTQSLNIKIPAVETM